MNAKHDLRCVECGYDLSGLPLDGTCPECGSRIALTIEERERRWSQRLPFLWISLGGSYLLSMLCYLLLCKFDLGLIRYSLLSLGPLWAFILATIVGAAAWPLICRVLPRDGWVVHAVVPYILVMLFSVGVSAYTSNPLRDMFLFMGWPIVLFLCWGVQSVVLKGLK